MTAVCVAVLVGFGSAATASASRAAGGPLSAKQCADGHSVRKKLRARDLALIERFIVCVGKQWTEPKCGHPCLVGGSGQGGFTALGGMPRVIRTLHGFAKASKSAETPQYMSSHLMAAVNQPQTCFWYVYGDTTPKRPTLKSINHWILDAHTGMEKVPVGAFLQTTAIVERGVWFHHGSRHNVRYAVVFVGDVVTPDANCSR